MLSTYTRGLKESFVLLPSLTLWGSLPFARGVRGYGILEIAVPMLTAHIQGFAHPGIKPSRRDGATQRSLLSINFIY